MSDEVSSDNSETMELALGRVNKAAVAAFIAGGITAVFGVAGFFITDVEGRLGDYLDPWVIIDAVLICVVAFFMKRKSLAACVIMTLYWMINLIVSIIIFGASGFGVISLLFLYYFINGIRGARTLRILNPPPKRTGIKRILVMSASILGFSLFVFLAVVGSMMETGAVPNTMVVEGDQLPHDHIAELKSLGTLQSDEQIELFYSAGILSYMEDGNMLTDRHVISYWQDEVEGFLQIVVPYEDIESVEVTSEGGALEDTILEVHLKDGDYFPLVLSTEDDGDKNFLQLLRSRLLNEPSESPDPLVNE